MRSIGQAISHRQRVIQLTQSISCASDAHLCEARLLDGSQPLHKRLRGPVVYDGEPGPVDLVEAHGALPQAPEAGLRFAFA